MENLSGFTSSNDDVIVLSPMEMLAQDDGLTLEEEVRELTGQHSEFSLLKSDLVAFAKRYIGRPYRSGAKGPNAFDCSGFTGFIFRNHGYSLGADSRMQARQGVGVNADDVEPGDLIFFSGRRGGHTVGHVGMVIDVDRASGKMKFIHASTRKGVVIQNFPDGAYYSKHFLRFRRVINDTNLIAKR